MCQDKGPANAYLVLFFPSLPFSFILGMHVDISDCKFITLVIKFQSELCNICFYLTITRERFKIKQC